MRPCTDKGECGSDDNQDDCCCNASPLVGDCDGGAVGIGGQIKLIGLA